MQQVRSDVVDQVTIEENVLGDYFNSKATLFQTSINAFYEEIAKGKPGLCNAIISKFNTYRAGLQKKYLSIDDDATSMFSYCEKGSKVDGQPTIVFVHGLSSNKETWLPIVKNIPSNYHCITVDLPAHGETIGMKEEFYTIDKFVEKLKLFFDKMNFTGQLFIIGASMGGAVVSMFAIKYPSYVSLICLLAPPADEQCETDRIKHLRQGNYEALLPETTEQLCDMINSLTVKSINLPRPFLNGFLNLRLQLLEEHKNGN
ncbi:unnamed protein product [Rotaria sp. Silwood1]|nr:unnamed protein product [Rotaria sp. Silwood1]